MQTQVVRESTNPVQAIAQFLEAGEVVILPADTSYMLVKLLSI